MAIKNVFRRVVMIAGLFVLPFAAMAAGMSVFDLTGQEKARGGRVQVSYPSGFESRDHEGFDEVRKFTRKSGEFEDILILHVIPNVSEKRIKLAMPVPGAVPQKEQHRLWTERLSGKNKWLHEICDTTADVRPAVLLTGQEVAERMDDKILQMDDSGSGAFCQPGV